MKFSIVDEPGTVVSIDVIDASHTRLSDLIRLGEELLDLARTDPQFIEGAMHVSIPALEQPLVWLGRVPLRRRFIGLYCRWQDGHRLGLAGTAQGRDLLTASRGLSASIDRIRHNPMESLYFPCLLDATGELCPNQDDCEAGQGIGPIIDDTNPRAQFINIFQTTPDRQQALLEGTFAIMPIARKHKGYLRTALHRGLTGTKVANYGQYQTVAQVRDMYFHAKTSGAFARLMFRDVTRPYTVFGRSVRFGRHVLGTAPELRCYTVSEIVRAEPIRRAVSSTDHAERHSNMADGVPASDDDTAISSLRHQSIGR